MILKNALEHKLKANHITHILKPKQYMNSFTSKITTEKLFEMCFSRFLLDEKYFLSFKVACKVHNQIFDSLIFNTNLNSTIAN